MAEDSGADDERLERVEPSAVVSDPEPPVVARMVVEIRSDGTRTIARGAIEDPEGQTVTVEAKGTTPLMLALELAGALWKLPRLATPSLRSLLPGRRRSRRRGRRRGDDD